MAEADPVLELRFSLTRDEFIATRRRLSFARPAPWALASLGLMVMALGVLRSSPGLVFFGVFYFVLEIIWIWQVRPSRSWQRLPYLAQEQVLVLANDAVQMTFPGAQSTTEWSFWTDLTLCHDVYVLRSSNGGYAMIPRRVLAAPEDERRLLELAARHVTPTSEPAAR